MRLLSILILSLCLSSPLFAADTAPVNINTADVATLAKGLKGVGQSKAEAIVKYRKTYGAFKAVDELESVKGIGSSIVAKNRDHIVLK